MNNITLGLLCGLIYGVIDVLIMIPVEYEDTRKRTEAMSAAFIERFMIGFLIPTVHLGISPAITGVLLGFFLSLPSAIITRAYAPIIAIGIIGGLIIGIVTSIVV